MINRQKYNLAVLSKLQEFLQKPPDFSLYSSTVGFGYH